MDYKKSVIGPDGQQQVIDMSPAEIAERQAEEAAAAIVMAEEVKKRARAAIDAERDATIAAGVTWNNKQWHSDPIFQTQLTAFIASFEAGLLASEAMVSIRTRNNTVEQLTYTQLKQLAGAVMTAVQTAYAISWAKKDALP